MGGGGKADPRTLPLDPPLRVTHLFLFHIMNHPRRPGGSQSGRIKRRDESFQVCT